MKRVCLIAIFGGTLLVAAARRAGADPPAGMFQPPPPGGAPGFSADTLYDVGYFYDPLARYGEWIEHPRFGWVWSPWGIPPDWRPYQYGRWVWTEYGWTWVSSEPFGWACYHYGRWSYDWRLGWVWVPDTVWGPAWVAWRGGGGWIGWAPLPPDAQWGGGGFVNDGFLSSRAIRRFSWSFVEDRRFTEVNVGGYVVQSSRNMYLFDDTRDWTRYAVRDGRIMNRGADLAMLEHRLGHPVERWSIRDETRWDRAGVVEGNRQLRMFRPRFEAKPGKPVAPKLAPIVAPRVSAETEAMRARQLAELQTFDRRMAAERAEMAARQQREVERWVRRGLRRDEVERKHKLEIGAFEERIVGERKLIERNHERELRGEFGLGQPGDRKFRVEPGPLYGGPKGGK
ncbi:MAG: DUF6600 domain-containing protein [Phycisphaerae bacterium]